MKLVSLEIKRRDSKKTSTRLKPAKPTQWLCVWVVKIEKNEYEVSIAKMGIGVGMGMGISPTDPIPVLSIPAPYLSHTHPI